MNIWWCTSHAAQGPNATVETDDGRDVEVPGIADGECWRSIWGETENLFPLCRVVEMRLVPVDALVIEKVAGYWRLTNERFTAAEDALASHPRDREPQRATRFPMKDEATT